MFEILDNQVLVWAIILSAVTFIHAAYRFVKWCIKKYKLKKRIEEEDGVFKWL